MARRNDAFVVWMDRQRGREAPTRDAFRGRVEHVPSSRRAHFASTEELLRFLEEQLGAEGPGEPEPDP